MMKNGLFLSIVRLGAAALALALLPRPAAAGQFEIYGHFGVTFPFYSETFTYDPGPVSLPIPGVTIRQEGVFTLDAQGGTAYGFGAGYYFVPAVALEARVDFATVDIQTQGARYDVNVTLPPFPAINAELDLGTGAVDVDTLTPVSFNLKFQTPGRFALGFSGGASYLPSFKFSARQTIALGVRELNAGEQQLEISTLPFAAIVQPDGGEGQSRWGFNAGVLLRIPFNEKVALVGDGRYFRFSEHTVTWARADNRPLNAIEQLLLAQVQQRLEPIRFRPQWFQVTGGLSITF
jgi:Outer membrane protein beta-barrel domain